MSATTEKTVSATAIRPRYGYSGKPRDLGWGPVRIAQAWDTLMKRLGYQSYVAQGGDWGAIITDLMGVQAPAGLLGIHTNMAGAVPADAWTVLVRNVFGAGWAERGCIKDAAACLLLIGETSACTSVTLCAEGPMSKL